MQVEPANVIRTVLGEKSDQWFRFCLLSRRFPTRTAMLVKQRFSGRTQRWWSEAATSKSRALIIKLYANDVIGTLERELMHSRHWIDA